MCLELSLKVSRLILHYEEWDLPVPVLEFSFIQHLNHMRVVNALQNLNFLVKPRDPFRVLQTL